MIKYEIGHLDEKTINELIALSIMWEEEGCSYGIRRNTIEDLHEPLVIAIDNNQIIGYAFGHYYQNEKKTAYIEVGDACFEVDEIYVHPLYRKMGVGKTLFQMLEELISLDTSYITLATSTKDYKSILKFYVEDLDMSFHSAFLIKKNKDK